MAKSLGPDVEAHLKDARSRMAYGFARQEFRDVLFRLNDLKKLLIELGENADSELYRHFPVAAVAALESYFKETIAKIVDTGSPYLERGLALAREKLRSSVEILPILHRKTVTVGELVAYSLAFNSVSSLENALGSLLDVDLKIAIGLAVDPIDVRNNWADRQPIVADVSALWKNISETFQRRHILAHEAATNYSVSFQEAQGAVKCVEDFARALDAVMWATIRKDDPLTQYEMNLFAWKAHRVTRNKLAERLKEGLAIASEVGLRRKFRQLHSSWKQYAGDWVQWENEQFITGSVRPLLAALARDRTFKARLADVDEWIMAWTGIRHLSNIS